MKKKGFTLIELLAVIIILAVIALIAAPVVLNIIEQVKIKGAESSAKGYAKAVGYEILNDTMFRKCIGSSISRKWSIRRIFCNRK